MNPPWYPQGVLFLSLLACTLKDGHDGLVNGSVGDDSADDGLTETEYTAPVDPTVDCVDGATLSFSPSPVPAAAPLTVTVTAETAYIWVGLSFEGPDTAQIGDLVQSGSGPYQWTAPVEGLSVGAWSVRFSADSGATVICTASVVAYNPG